ncbi:MAG: ATP-dependent metalloprotease, partial [Perlucidibaca sp.]
NMVTKWGLSEKLGPLLYEEDEGEVFLGRSVTQRKNVSSQTAIDIDNEIRSVIDRCYAHARQILVDNRDILDAMADALMKYETIDAEQVDDLMARRDLRSPRGWNDGDKSGGTPVAVDQPGDKPVAGEPAPGAL